MCCRVGSGGSVPAGDLREDQPEQWQPHLPVRSVRPGVRAEASRYQPPRVHTLPRQLQLPLPQLPRVLQHQEQALQARSHAAQTDVVCAHARLSNNVFS